MKKLLLASVLTSFLLGCSTTSPRPNLDQFSEYSGGLSMGDATSFYWYTEKLTKSNTAADYVSAGDYGWYKSDYRWDENQLREFIREGQQLSFSDNGLVPYRIHVRFNKEGDAIYQQYRLNGKVLPLQREQLQRYQQESLAIIDTTKQQNRDGVELIQGYWDGSEFETCSGREFNKFEFNQTLPSFVINRLASIDSYVAFLGRQSNRKLEVTELLMLADDDHDCIERTSLLD